MVVISAYILHYCSRLLKEYTEGTKIKWIFLPPYSPNPNLIERYWKFFKKKVLNNRYYETFGEFKRACESFFRKEKEIFAGIDLITDRKLSHSSRIKTGKPNRKQYIKQCPLSRNCPAKQQSDKRTYYFDRSDYLLGKRNRNIKSLPPERRKLRPNTEVTVKEFTKPFNHKGKLRVRGLLKTMVYAHAMAISINFGRVWRYMAENPDFFALSNLLCGILPCFFARNSENELRKIIIRDKSCCWLEPQQYFRQAA
jgi:transposase